MNKKLLLGFTFLSIFTIIVSFSAGLAGSYLGSKIFNQDGISLAPSFSEVEVIDQQSAIINVAEEASPAVVSIIITKDLPIYEDYLYNPFGDNPFFEEFGVPRQRQNGTEEQQIGAGTGFIVSKDGTVITNRHVVSDGNATYTVILNDNTQYDAEILGRDTILDIAVLKIKTTTNLPFLPIGDSDVVKVGQTTIAIGNSLGEFSNTVSTGIISGLSRNIVASSGNGSASSRLNGLIQTDASINFGNSGGPLLDIGGNVIGVNVAIADDAENIGFAIPINSVKTIIDSIAEYGEIVRPYLGVRYVSVDAEIAEENSLDVTFGALIINGSNGEAAVLADSPADQAGLKVGDVILKVDNKQVNLESSLQSLIQQHKVGEEIELEILRDGEQLQVEVTLKKASD